MTNTPKKQSITEIDKLLHFCIEWKGEDKRYEDELIKDTKQALKQLILTEIIGGDPRCATHGDSYLVGMCSSCDIAYSVKLSRDKIRQRVEEVFEGNE